MWQGFDLYTDSQIVLNYFLNSILDLFLQKFHSQIKNSKLINIYILSESNEILKPFPISIVKVYELHTVRDSNLYTFEFLGDDSQGRNRNENVLLFRKAFIAV